LTGAEREQLQRWTRRAKTSQVLALQAKIVVAYSEGAEGKKVAVGLRTTEHNVAHWRGRFIRQLLDGLHDEKRPCWPPSILLDKVEEVVTATLEERRTPLTGHGPPWPGAAACRSPRSGGSDGSSTSSRTSSRGFKLSTDLLFVEKVVDVVGLCHNPPEKAVVLCVDEKSQVQGPEPVPAGAADDARHARAAHP
jgi:hypothetical protein